MQALNINLLLLLLPLGLILLCFCYSRCYHISGKISKQEAADDGTVFEFSTIVIVAGIIGGTIVLAVAVIVCGVVYIQKYK